MRCEWFLILAQKTGGEGDCIWKLHNNAFIPPEVRGFWADLETRGEFFCNNSSKNRLPSEIQGPLTDNGRKMDKGQTTTRKGFLRRSGLAIAGLFAWGKASSATRERTESSEADINKDRTLAEVSARRLKPARGGVRYRS